MTIKKKEIPEPTSPRSITQVEAAVDFVPRNVSAELWSPPRAHWAVQFLFGNWLP